MVERIIGATYILERDGTGEIFLLQLLREVTLHDGRGGYLCQVMRPHEAISDAGTGEKVIVNFMIFRDTTDEVFIRRNPWLGPHTWVPGVSYRLISDPGAVDRIEPNEYVPMGKSSVKQLG